MKKIIFKGAATALATPFTNDEINYNEFKRFIEFQISNKIDALVVCGTTGESACMTLQEKKEAIKFVVDTVNHRVPVIAGTGSNCTKNAIELSKYAENVGADGLLIVTPYYNKTNKKGIITHYSEIAKNTNLPIILYNVPSRTGMNLTPDICFELSKLDNIVGIKEASGNISQITEIANICKDNLAIYSGNDDQIVPILSIGGLGVISVLSNIAPRQTHDIVYSYLNNNTNLSCKLQLDALPLIKTLFIETNPIPVKYGLNLMGYDFGKPRFPLVELSDEYKNKLKNEMEKYNLLSA